jgi:hypothetical protein
MCWGEVLGLAWITGVVLLTLRSGITWSRWWSHRQRSRGRSPVFDLLSASEAWGAQKELTKQKQRNPETTVLVRAMRVAFYQYVAFLVLGFVAVILIGQRLPAC